MAIDSWLTIESDCAAGAGDDAHGSNILLAKGVLHAGDDRTDGRRLQRRARRVCEGVPRVEGGLFGGHGGRNGRQCRLEQSSTWW